MTWYEIKRAIIRFFTDIRIYPGGFILFGESHYQLKGPDMRQVLNNLEPGDVLLRRYSHYIGSLIVPGYWSHIALYVGGNSVIHMLGTGITIEDILSFMRCDDLSILRCDDPIKKRAAIANAYDQLGKKIEYDYDFNTESAERFYCSEFTDFCYGYPSGRKKSPILPDDFLDIEMFKMVWKKDTK